MFRAKFIVRGDTFFDFKDESLSLYKMSLGERWFRKVQNIWRVIKTAHIVKYTLTLRPSRGFPFCWLATRWASRGCVTSSTSAPPRSCSGCCCRPMTAHQPAKNISFEVQNVARIQINEVRWLFLSWFWPFLKRATFLVAAGAVVEIGSSQNITNFIQVNLVKIRETDWTDLGVTLVRKQYGYFWVTFDHFWYGLHILT